MCKVKLATALLTCTLVSLSSFGQGIPEFSTVQNNDLDIVELPTLNVILSPNIRAKAGADPFSFLVTINSSPNAQTYPYAPDIMTESHLGFLTHQTVVTTCGGQLQTPTNAYINWLYVDGSGASHAFNVQTDSQKCLNQVLSGMALDGSGYSTVITSGSPNAGPVYDVAGGTHASTFVDNNGNMISQSSGIWTDTLATTALTVSNGNYTYTDAAGNQQTVAVTAPSATYGSVCDSNVASSFNPITGISYPDGSSMQFSYEQISGSTKLTGRLSSVTLRSGAKITYAYSGGTSQGILCQNGTESNATMTRTTPDGTWTYTRTLNGSITTTRVTDPAGNYTTYTFIEGQGYEIYRQSYSSTGTLLLSKGTCYNGAAPNCSSQTGVAVPIGEVDVYTYIPGVANPSALKTSYNSYGLPTERKLYDFGASTPTQDKLITYGSYSSGSCAAISTYINDRPCMIIIKDGSGAIHGQTNNTYDSKGNLLSTSNLVSGSTYLTTSYTYSASGSMASKTDPNGGVTTFSNFTCNNVFPQTTSLPIGLTTSATWDCDGGVHASSTDSNGAVVSYNYVSQSTADPLWRPLSVTDPLSNVSSFNYQPSTSSLIPEIARTMVFGNSVESNIGYFDWQGKVAYDQRLTAPAASTFDTVSYVYDNVGRLSTVSQPCTTGAHTACPSAAVTYTYDGLNRPLTITDGNQGQVTYAYNSNDVLMTWGPVPPGETNTKQVQMEYNGLGQLVSVCRITNASGSGPCGQANTAGLNFTTGYVTKYTYDTLGDVVKIQQNTQGLTSQTRSFAYDDRGRLTSRTDPESGTTTFTWDNVGAGFCASTAGAYSSPGDLVATADANGNHVCYYYERWHRVTDTGNNQQSSTNYCRRFRYDSTTNGVQPVPSGATITNVSGRIVEAETDNCANSPNFTPITDEWFSYDKDGRLTDVWEATTHSGGYYHASASFFPNGVLAARQLDNPSSAPSVWNYTLDSQGRLSGAIQNSTGQGVSGVIYDASSKPITVSFTSGSQDSFTYDHNTERMTSFSYATTTAAYSGTLTWNPNGTLQQLAIADGFNGSGTHTCTYGSSGAPGYDQLGRLVNVNCGTAWTQTFSYDPFGNVTKSGTSSWMPGYNEANNRYQNGSQYDSNGNLLYDTFNTYTWNVYNKPATIISGNSSASCGTSGTCIVYDAFGRPVESNVSGTIAQTFYEPAGKSFMSGQAVTQIRLPLPGGSTMNQVIGASSGSIWHKDWLGSVRIATALSGVEVFERAFAPYGEMYDALYGSGVVQNFTGDTQDVFPGLFDTPAREFHSVPGRWISPDLTSSSNRYVYGANDPLSFIDPSGNSIVDAESSTWLGFEGFNMDSLDGGDNASLKDDLSTLLPGNSGVATYYAQACAFCSVWGEGEYLDDWGRQEYMRGVIAQNQAQSQSPISWWHWKTIKAFVSLEAAVTWELVKATDHWGLFTVTLYFSYDSLQHAYDLHGNDFGFTTNRNKENLAQFQQELENIVKGPNTVPYTVDYRGQAGYTVFLDQPTGKMVMFDSNNEFVSAWELGADQIRGVVVNGKLW